MTLAEVAKKKASEMDTESITTGIGKNKCCFLKWLFVLINTCPCICHVLLVIGKLELSGRGGGG